MNTFESTLVDTRALNPHWLHVFRLRISGWLPKAAADEARRQGTMTYSSDGRPSLTDYGRSLTDQDSESESEINAILIASSIITHGATLKDFSSPRAGDGAFLAEEDMLPETYRKLVCETLEREEVRAKR